MATGKFVPTKPHFCKPLLTGFEHGVSIPVKFFKDYLKDQEYEKATLRGPGNRIWEVKIKNLRFVEGWEKLVQELDLSVGDILVFRHEGNMVFDFMVFDRSACGREYPVSDIKQEIITVEESEEVEVFDEEEPEEEAEEEEEVARESTSDEIIEIEEGEAAAAEEEATEEETAASTEVEEEEIAKQSAAKKSQKKKGKRTAFEASNAEVEHLYPYFEKKLTSFSSKQGRLPIPLRFSRLHNLHNTSCEVVLLDPENRTWPVKFQCGRSHDQVYIGIGWSSCRDANGLKGGESLIFQLIQNGENPVFKFSKKVNMMEKQPMANLEAKASSSLNRPKKLKPMTNLKAKASSAVEHTEELKKQQQINNLKADTSSTLEDSDLEINLTSSSFSRSRVYIQENYVKLHNLRSRSKEVILMDQEGRNWPAKLWKSTRGCYIYGWQGFHAANDIKPEETLSFKLTEKGNRTVFKLCNKFIKKREPAITVKSKASSVQECPHFVAEVNSTSISQSKLCVRGDFSKINNLKDASEMVLMNQEGRSWLVKLQTASKVTLILDWNNFRVANDIKLGDSLMFMLMEKGKRPVVKMCRLRSSSSSQRNPYFSVTMNSYSFQKHMIKIPIKFAMKYGFSKYSKMIIENEKGKSWSVSVARDYNGVFRICNCNAFFKENDLGIGSVLMLELVKRGNKPVMKFYGHN